MGTEKQTIKSLIAAAEPFVARLSVSQVQEHLKKEDIVLIDVRDVRERWRDGYIAGSLHVPRGMLEFWIDPKSPYHKEVFAQDKHFVFYCASSWRSALCGQTAHMMGLKTLSHLDGGFSAWVKAKGAVEHKDKTEITS